MSTDYSLRRLFTGVTKAILMIWKLTVTKAIKMIMPAASANTYQDNGAR
ncbi:hypothetical protein [Mucilaginibacter sp. L3T2-6]|nr:hypothetical protein [Mucilaginibacter sp. L3T2-6]MDO3641312.1 hypothetical protein [Mucilaginibacter sp. L3T2-6]MDV6213928.1 hypothetical protein [Mucilaginibacter sp. L3T2-6]